MKEKQEKALSEDMKSLVSKESIQVRLPGPSNFLDGAYQFSKTEAIRVNLRPEDSLYDQEQH